MAEKGDNVFLGAGSEGGDLQVDLFGTDNSDRDNTPDDPLLSVGASEEDDASDGEEETEEESEESEVSDEETDDDEAAEDDEQEGDDEDEDEVDDEQENVKKIKVLVGDEHIDLPLDAKIPTTANGKVSNPTLADLQNAYASNATRVQELAQIKQGKEELQADKRKAQRDIERRGSEIIAKEESLAREAEAVKRFDIETIVNEACHRAGVEAADMWDQLDEMFSRYYSGDDKTKGFTQLDPATRRSIQLNRRAVLQNAKIERMKAEGEAKEANLAIESTKSSILEKTNLTLDEVEEAWESLSDRAKAGKIPQNEVERIKKLAPLDRFKYAAAEALANRTNKRVSSIVEKSYPKLKGKVGEIVRDIEDVMGTEYAIKASDKNIADLIAKVYNQDKSNGETRKDSKIATTGKLRDKASPRHKVSAASENEDDDLYAQDKGNLSSQVWDAGFKTFP